MCLRWTRDYKGGLMRDILLKNNLPSKGYQAVFTCHTFSKKHTFHLERTHFKVIHDKH